MSALSFTPSSTLARRLALLARLYERGHADAVTTQALDKLLAYEAEQCRRRLAEVRKDLQAFEQTYGWASAEFFQRYQSGQTDDRLDFVEWAALCQMQDNLLQRLALLSGENEA